MLLLIIIESCCAPMRREATVLAAKKICNQNAFTKSVRGLQAGKRKKPVEV
jgi:hypothetical protein